MINVILTIIFVNFIPAFMLSDAGNMDLLAKSNLTLKGQEVLGEAKNDKDLSKGSENDLGRCDLFPPGQPTTSYTPARKKGIPDLKLWAGSSVVIDVDSGTLLHYDSGRKRTQIASLTKMMTAILTVENIKDLDEEVTITSDALNVPGTVVGCPTSVLCTSNRMHKGEKVKAIDLLRVMLLNSANDAATALGIHIAGSPDKFADMMNEKAKTMGLKDTHFCTPSGLEIDGQEDKCYSSAYDIARISAYSLKYNLIWDIMRMTDGQFYSTDGKTMHVMKNTDLLLGSIPNCLGGKTGFTPMAGKSLLMGSIDSTGKHRIMAVILNDEDRWEDMTRLVNWVFASYEWK